MNQLYVPISCAAHEELLAAATLRRSCRLTVALDQGQSVDVDGIIVDVYSLKGSEYLQLRDGTNFRLDQILALDGKPITGA